MATIYEKIAPNEAFPDDAAARVREVEKKEAGRLEQSEWFGRFAYVQSDDSCFDMLTRREIARNVFRMLCSVMSIAVRYTRRQAVCRRPSITTNVGRSWARLRLSAITFAAGEDALVTRDGLVYRQPLDGCAA